jgi:hypothetical protein
MPVILIPLKDAPSSVSHYYRACSHANAGQYPKAISLLREMYKIPLYRIVAAKKINEIFRAAGKHDQLIRNLPLPLEWTSTDGNIPVYLYDPYGKIMREAANEQGVVTVNFDLLTARKRRIYLDYIHLNEYGHRLLAEELFNILKNSKELNFPQS